MPGVAEEAPLPPPVNVLDSPPPPLPPPMSPGAPPLPDESPPPMPPTGMYVDK